MTVAATPDTLSERPGRGMAREMAEQPDVLPGKALPATKTYTPPSSCAAC